MRTLLALVAGLLLVGYAMAECPNACSGHGDCGKYDQCTCWRNWQAADCSQRTCPFALAHVDTPKGDLNHDNSISAPSTTVISGSTVYPTGTTEEFPAMEDSAGTALENTAHYYMECSNKGLCNRKSGECECFDGYDGNACQRASCPNDCSGHGVCKTIQQLADADNSNMYELWDQHSTMGCECDSGYYGADCSLRRCKYGVDPLFCTAENKPRYPQWTFHFESTAALTSSTETYSIVFYDAHGEDWETDPITFTPNADNCNAVTTALEALPNTVIPADSVTCNNVTYTTKKLVYTLTFGSNPGALKQPTVNKYLEGSTATLSTDNEYVYPQDGVSGEWTDAVPTHCSTVLVNLNTGDAVATAGNTLGDETSSTTAFPYLSFSSSRSGGASEFKSCLGDSDGTTSNNVDVENWDYGAQQNATTHTEIELVWPHLVKIIRADAKTQMDAVYSLLFWDNTDSRFHMGAPLDVEDVPSGADFEIFTTDSTLQLVYDDTNSNDLFQSSNSVEEKIVITAMAGSDTSYASSFYTTNNTGSGLDVSCETNKATLSTCLEKGDQVVLHQPGNNWGLNSVNLFTIVKIYDEQLDAGGDQSRFRIDLDRTMPQNYHGGFIYKYTAGSEPYTYVSECSGRGTCDEDSGLCECFRGYTGDDCATQSSFAT